MLVLGIIFISIHFFLCKKQTQMNIGRFGNWITPYLFFFGVIFSLIGIFN